jgi:hypothetical protein
MNISNTPGKQLRAKIFYPARESAEDAEPILSDVPYPTLIFIPGWAGSLEQATIIAKTLCGHGFCLVSVDSRSTTFEYERSKDQMAALDWIKEHNEDSSFALNNMFDISKIGAIGYSNGGRGSLLSVLNSPEFKVLITIDSGLMDSSGNDVRVPMLVFAGTKFIEEVEQFFEMCNSPKFLVVTDDSHSTIVSNSIVHEFVSVFCKVYLSGDEGFIPYLYGEYAQEYVGDELVDLRYDVSEGRTEFSFDDLVVEPDSIFVGDNMTASWEVSNSGTKSGRYFAWVEIENEDLDRIVYWDAVWITLDPDVSEIVEFDFSPKRVGDHIVTVGTDYYNITAHFSAVEKVDESTTEIEEPEEETNNWIPGFPVLSILAALVLYYLLREWMK